MIAAFFHAHTLYIAMAVMVLIVGIILGRAQVKHPSADSSNITAANAGSLSWDPANVQSSLNNLQTYVEAEANKSLDWYWGNKRSKAKISRYIQFSAIVLTALGGLFPVIAVLAKNLQWPYLSESGLWSSLFVGLAAALVGLDRAFGYSSGWARYVLTATAIRKRLEEFRLDWALLMTKLPPAPKPDDLVPLLQCAKDFRISVEALVVQETREWATEFQNNVAQLEKDIKAQIERLKAQVDKTIEAHTLAAKTGAIQVTVTNAEKTDGFQYDVSLDTDASNFATEKVIRSKTWARTGIPPGQYRLSIKAAFAGNPANSAGIVIIKPDEVITTPVTLA